ncbi:hypothetical protein JRQ81_011014 [Phrynocephalus forsythii]|uniref:Uncharacterized protein n=1 Tax=Phrynocephalus forsythii TaxID=171643 RepID=A0A9Q0X7C6_9SAUR|nr:hypothetical protein JRQ81_011014 [Phrynocephalus forsythii]
MVHDGQERDEGSHGPHQTHHPSGPALGHQHLVLERRRDGQVAVHGDGAQGLDAGRHAQHVQGGPQLADGGAVGPAAAQHQRGPRGHHQQAHDEVGAGQRGDEDVGHGLEAGGLGDGHDHQQVACHRHQHGQAQRGAQRALAAQAARRPPTVAAAVGVALFPPPRPVRGPSRSHSSPDGTGQEEPLAVSPLPLSPGRLPTALLRRGRPPPAPRLLFLLLRALRTRGRHLGLRQPAHAPGRTAAGEAATERRRGDGRPPLRWALPRGGALKGTAEPGPEAAGGGKSQAPHPAPRPGSSDPHPTPQPGPSPTGPKEGGWRGRRGGASLPSRLLPSGEIAPHLPRPSGFSASRGRIRNLADEGEMLWMQRNQHQQGL